MDDLPDDVLTEVLRRVPARGLAACRGVCMAWRALVDGDGRLLRLRTELLPHKLAGIYLTVNVPMFFARPAPVPVRRGLGYLPDRRGIDHLLDCCNGLLLVGETVVNPATRRWACLPPRPRRYHPFYCHHRCIAFDPTVSPHYEVFLIPILCEPGDLGSRKEYQYETEFEEQDEWPPNPFDFCVYSSRTGQWEEKPFIRQGRAVGTISQIRAGGWIEESSATYWREALYILCQNNYFMRICLSSDKYQVIELPKDIKASGDCILTIGKCKNGVQCASIHDRCRLRVWFLNESCDETKWVLKHYVDLGPILAQCKDDEEIFRPWTLHPFICNEDRNYGIDQGRELGPRDNTYDGNQNEVNEVFDWDSDNDNVVYTKDDGVSRPYDGDVYFLGFHPYKEIVFLHVSSRKGVSYHLNCSKVQDLGTLAVYKYDDGLGIEASFMYTPCLVGEPSENN